MGGPCNGSSTVGTDVAVVVPLKKHSWLKSQIGCVTYNSISLGRLLEKILLGTWVSTYIHALSYPHVHVMSRKPQQQFLHKSFKIRDQPVLLIMSELT